MPKPKPDFYIYRRMLPHWRLRGATYFVTWRLYPNIPKLTESERDVVQSAIRRTDGRSGLIHAYVVMDDHVHVLVTPSEGNSLDRIVRAWKSVSSRHIGKSRDGRSGIWQQEYFDRIVRDESEFLEKARYILNNPKKRWPELETYAWVGSEADQEDRGGSEDPPPPTTLVAPRTRNLVVVGPPRQ